MRQRCVRVLSTCGVAALAFLFGRGDARGDIVSAFNTGDEGWTWSSFKYPNTNPPTVTSSGNSVVWHSTGGEPGGFIGVGPDPDSNTTMFTAPSTFLGDQSGMASLSYSFFDNYSTGSLYSAPEVVLVGNNGQTLVFEDDSIKPNLASWIHVGTNFAPSSDWSLETAGGTVVPATASDFSSVLADVKGLYIRTEFYLGSGDNMGLDNVVLSTNAVPEPSSFLLGLTGGGALWLFGWKRRRQSRDRAEGRRAA